jgi:hypothetical protein
LPIHIRASACASISRTRRASGRRGASATSWWKRGERPPGLLDQRYVNAYIYAAIEPGTDDAFALILPDANRVAMQAFLDAFAETIADGEHVALVLDGAGWHSSKALRVPAGAAAALLARAQSGRARLAASEGALPVAAAPQ